MWGTRYTGKSTLYLVRSRCLRHCTGATSSLLCFRQINIVFVSHRSMTRCTQRANLLKIWAVPNWATLYLWLNSLFCFLERCLEFHFVISVNLRFNKVYPWFWLTVLLLITFKSYAGPIKPPLIHFTIFLIGILCLHLGEHLQITGGVFGLFRPLPQICLCTHNLKSTLILIIE